MHGNPSHDYLSRVIRIRCPHLEFCEGDFRKLQTFSLSFLNIRDSQKVVILGHSLGWNLFRYMQTVKMKALSAIVATQVSLPTDSPFSCDDVQSVESNQSVQFFIRVTNNTIQLVYHSYLIQITPLGRRCVHDLHLRIGDRVQYIRYVVVQTNSCLPLVKTIR